MHLLLVLLACRGDDASSNPEPAPPPIDLVEALGAGEVRAGVVTDPAALFGGTSAEGRVGDVKLYNDRVRFVVQGLVGSSYYIETGGTVVDADLVRPDGSPGRDIVDELTPMYGLGRVMMPTQITVVSDGTDGAAAVVRVIGVEAPLGLIEGALETPGFVPNLGLTMTTEYRLEPDSWLLEVHSEVTAGVDSATLAMGDLFMGAPEVADPWAPGSGLAGDAPEGFLWTGFMGRRNDVAVGLVAAEGTAFTAGGYDLLTELADMVIGFGPSVEVAPGETLAWTRYYGVAPDIATLSDAALAVQGAPTEATTGQVTAPDGPVPGARVNLMVDGAPFAIAVTDADGRYTAQVPVGAKVEPLADGRGAGLFLDLPDGAGDYSPYVDPAVRSQVLATFVDGSASVPQAQGRGVGTPSDPLTLGLPAALTVRVDDGLPFAVRVGFVDPDVAVDDRLIGGRPDGLAAAGWARDGAVDLVLEPGAYDITVWRGMRYELFTERLTLAAGTPSELVATLPRAIEHPGWTLGDPHQHASPSSDGAVPMADRLITGAGVGVQVHFGTDHDHVADYRPLVDALGLQAHLRSVVADEVSPPLRGHFNIYPIEPAEEANGGAWTWWGEIPETTEAMVDALRARHGESFVIQSNHPTDSGLAEMSDWAPGVVGDGERWTWELGAVEALNSGEHEAFTAFYLDLLNRGYVVTPTGVSDSHGHFSGSIGLSATWFGVGSDAVEDWSDDALVEAMAARRTVASLGVFLATSVDPGAVIGPGTTVEVEARSASWIGVDRLHLLRDGEIIETVDGTSATFDLDADRDASFVVIAEGDAPMAPISGRTPWAMTSAWLLDVDGDGWTPPLPALVVE
ncbi:MAG: hypothetical protein ACI8PZ_001816 [Myxococcota bacterium]